MSIIEELQKEQPYYWSNNNKKSWEDAQKELPLNTSIIDEAEQRLHRFAPYFIHMAPETIENNGLIESPLQQLQKCTGDSNQTFFIKRDDILPISGSIKARGGIYEVLKIAEDLAHDHHLINEEKDYAQFADASFHTLFSTHTIVVGSTGNLGLSIGIMSAQLGFEVVVHMSNDAKQWKKEMLRQKGATVIEHVGDYGEAVKQAREEAAANDSAFFIDDENSHALFSGYSVAARRVAQQLVEQGIEVSAEKKLAVYLPCGVGGGPGGVAFGLKTIFGDNVECYFAEPIQSPCMMLGMATGKHHHISVQEIGLSNKTAADGLAVGRASKFVGELMTPLLEGIYTVSDDRLFETLAELYDAERIKLEPSAASSLVGPEMTHSKATTHIMWATGGGMVPQSEWQRYYERGER